MIKIQIDRVYCLHVAQQGISKYERILHMQYLISLTESLLNYREKRSSVQNSTKKLVSPIASNLKS